MATYKIKGIKDMRVGYVSGGAIVYEDVPFGSELALDADVADVNFEGDGQIEKEYYDAAFSGSFSADKFKTDVLQRVFGKTPVTVGLPSGVASRQYIGTEDELGTAYIEVGVTLDAIDDATGASAELRVTVFNAKAGPYIQQNMGTRTKMNMQITWTGRRTSNDINGDPLPGVPTGGAVYAIDILS